MTVYASVEVAAYPAVNVMVLGPVMVGATGGAVAGNTAVITPLFSALLTLVALATIKKLAATPVSVKPAFGVNVMVAV